MEILLDKLSKIKVIPEKPVGITIGKIKGRFFKEEVLTDQELNHHVHIVGASGYGKTVFISHIVKDKIQKGKGMAFVDLKGDIETINKFKRFAKEANREDDVLIFSLSDQSISSSYNLISSGTPTQLRDKIVSSLIWSEEFYKNQSASFLLKLLMGLCYLRDHENLKLHLGVILDCTNDFETLANLILKVPHTEKKAKKAFEECYQFLNDRENFKSLQGFRSQLESLVLSDFGDLIVSEEKGINLFEAISHGKLVFMFLDSRRYGESAKAVGKFILQDLKMVSAKIDSEVPKESRKHFVCIIDEFADLAQEDFISFLDRARSSKVAIVVAHQEISDLKRVSPEFANRLMGNTSTLYAFLQPNQESAELIASRAGTQKAWKETVRSERMWVFDWRTGDKSLREVEEFRIHPNVIKSLRVGECVVVKKYPRARAHIIQVNPEV